MRSRLKSPPQKQRIWGEDYSQLQIPTVTNEEDSILKKLVDPNLCEIGKAVGSGGQAKSQAG